MPNREVFAEAIKNSANPVCYNGDLFDLEKCQAFETEFPQVDICMLGQRPSGESGIGAGTAGWKNAGKQELREFHDAFTRNMKR